MQGRELMGPQLAQHQLLRSHCSPAESKMPTLRASLGSQTPSSLYPQWSKFPVGMLGYPPYDCPSTFPPFFQMQPMPLLSTHPAQYRSWSCSCHPPLYHSSGDIWLLTSLKFLKGENQVFFICALLSFPNPDLSPSSYMGKTFGRYLQKGRRKRMEGRKKRREGQKERGREGRRKQRQNRFLPLNFQRI